ncbi:DUF4258 domain-containing protein, partial [Candidatus Woesebacteria bacterium]|nr:DUF4258 domain-containing protein [Candidatus Woesebacteria bacterium]
MKIEFSKHARERIKTRRISKNRVVKTIQNSAKILQSFRFRKLFQKNYGDKMLEVVTKIENRKIIVITAYYLRNKNENK